MRLTFSERPDAEADLHPAVRGTTGHNPEAAPYPDDATDETADLGFVVSTPYVIREAGVTLRFRNAIRGNLVLSVQALPIQPDLLYLSREDPRRYYQETSSRLMGTMGAPPQNRFDASQYDDFSGVIEYSPTFPYTLFPSDCLTVLIVFQSRSGQGTQPYWNNIDYVHGWLDLEGCSKLGVSLQYPDYSQVTEALPVSLTMANVGECPGRFVVSGEEFFLDKGQAKTISQEMPFVVKDRMDYGRGAERLFAVSNPKPRTVLPDLATVEEKSASGATTAVRLLWIDEESLLMVGDAPGGETISYQGLLMADKIEGEFLPALPLQGTLGSLETRRIGFSNLRLCRLSFSTEVRIVEYGVIRGDTKDYELNLLPGPLYTSRTGFLPIPGVRGLGVPLRRKL